jgi:hypothetical protein
MDIFNEKCLAAKAILWKSNIRQVPNHQEVFLSNTTLTSIVIEINERLDQEASTSIADGSVQMDVESLPEDIRAALLHLHEICYVNGDSYEILDSPRSIELANLKVPAYVGQALITSRTQARGGAGNGSFETPGVLPATSTCHFLLIRLLEQQTDILVQVIVPHAELEASATVGAVAQEEMFAHGIMARLITSLDIKDWGLFGE